MLSPAIFVADITETIIELLPLLVPVLIGLIAGLGRVIGAVMERRAEKMRELGTEGPKNPSVPHAGTAVDEPQTEGQVQPKRSILEEIRRYMELMEERTLTTPEPAPPKPPPAKPEPPGKAKAYRDLEEVEDDAKEEARSREVGDVPSTPATRAGRLPAPAPPAAAKRPAFKPKPLPKLEVPGMNAGRSGQGSGKARRRGGFRLDRSRAGLRHGIVLTEVLGPPLADREPRS